MARYATFRGVVDHPTGATSADCFLFEAHASCTARDLLSSLGFSRASIARLFARCQLLLEGSPPRVLHAQSPVNPGDRIVLVPQVTRAGGKPDSGAVRVLYRDPFVLAVDKPAGLLVHGDGTSAPTLTDRVQGYLTRTGSFVVPQAVQRLDVDTTGVVLFSLTEEFQPLFDALVANGGMCKRYLAVVRGTFPERTSIIEAPLARDRHDARRMRVSAHGGCYARTEVERLAVSGDGSRSLLGVRLGTGRKHQIRVHMAAQGHPVVNDSLYGSAEDSSGLALHAFTLSFEHPVTGAAVHVCAGWPDRFARWFDPAAPRLAPYMHAAMAGEEASHAAHA